MRAHVREEIVDHLPQAVSIADHGCLIEAAGDHTLRLEHSGGLHRLGHDVVKLDPLALERPALVEAGEQEQILDENAHSLGFARDPRHRALEVGRPLRGSAREQLGIGPHRCERSAELVRSVGDESP